MTKCKKTLMKISKKMKKVLFFALLLTILGAASVNAQVRIGGDGAPHPTAVLDLNVTDATDSGNLGLALPRVNLIAETTQLNGTNPKDGTLVYNTNTGFGAGLYYWVTGKWVKLTIDGGASPALNVTAELDDNYTVKPEDDIVLFTTASSVRMVTLPTTGVAIGKTVYISVKGSAQVDLAPESMRTDAYLNIYPGFSCTVVYVGGGKWMVSSGGF
jgi:hypothetical protein